MPKNTLKYWNLLLINIIVISLAVNLDRIEHANRAKRYKAVNLATLNNLGYAKRNSNTDKQQVSSKKLLNAQDDQAAAADSASQMAIRPQIKFNSDYFQVVDDPNGAQQFLLKAPLSYQKFAEANANERFSYEDILNLLNSKELKIEIPIKERFIYKSWHTNVKLFARTIQILLNQEPMTTSHLSNVQVINLLNRIQKYLAHTTNFGIDKTWITKFETPEKAANEFTRHINKILGTDPASNKKVEELEEHIESIRTWKKGKEDQKKYQITKLETFLHDNPDWFNLEDRIDLNNNWETRWEDNYDFKWEKIKNLVPRLKAEKEAEISLVTVLDSLERYVRNKKRVQLRISTNKEKIITIDSALDYDIYTPLVSIQPSQEVQINDLMSLVTDWLKYTFWNSENYRTNSTKDDVLKPQKVGYTQEHKTNFKKLFEKIVEQTRIFVDAKNLAYENDEYFYKIEDEKGLKYTDLLKLFAPVDFISDFFDIKGEVKKELGKQFDSFLRSDKIADSRQILLEYLAKIRSISFLEKLKLKQSDFQNPVSGVFQTRITNLLGENVAQLAGIMQQIQTKKRRQTVNFVNNVVQNLKLAKYIPHSQTEAKNLLLLNFYDQNSVDDYMIALRQIANEWQIVYLAKSYLVNQLDAFVNDYRGHLTTATNLNATIPQKLWQPAIINQIKLMQKHQIAFPAKFGLKIDDFDAEGKLKLQKITDDSLTEINKYWINKELDASLLNKLIDINEIKAANKLVLIQNFYEGETGETENRLIAILKEQGIDEKILENKDPRLQDFAKTAKILEFDIPQAQQKLWFLEVEQHFEDIKSEIQQARDLGINLDNIFATTVFKDVKDTDFDELQNLKIQQKLQGQQWTRSIVDTIKNELNKPRIQQQIDWFEAAEKHIAEIQDQIREAKRQGVNLGRLFEKTILNDITNADFDSAGILQNKEKLRGKEWTQKIVDNIRSELDKAKIRTRIDLFTKIKPLIQAIETDFQEAKILVNLDKSFKNTVLKDIANVDFEATQVLNDWLDNQNESIDDNAINNLKNQLDKIEAQIAEQVGWFEATKERLDKLKDKIEEAQTLGINLKRFFEKTLFSNIGNDDFDATGNLVAKDKLKNKAWTEDAFNTIQNQLSRARLQEQIDWFKEVTEHIANIKDEIRGAKVAKINLNRFFRKTALNSVNNADFDDSGSLRTNQKLKDIVWSKEVVKDIKKALDKAHLQEQIRLFTTISQRIDEVANKVQTAKQLVNLNKIFKDTFLSKIISDNFDAAQALNDWLAEQTEPLSKATKLKLEDDLKENEAQIAEQVGWFEATKRRLDDLKNEIQQAQALGVNLKKFFFQKTFLTDITSADFNDSGELLNDSKLRGKTWTQADFDKIESELSSKKINKKIKHYQEIADRIEEIKQHLEEIKNEIREVKLLGISLPKLFQETLLNDITDADFDSSGILKTDQKLKSKEWMPGDFEKLESVLDQAQLKKRIKDFEEIKELLEEVFQNVQKIQSANLNQLFKKGTFLENITSANFNVVQALNNWLNAQPEPFSTVATADLKELLEQKNHEIANQVAWFNEIKQHLGGLKEQISQLKSWEINLSDVFKKTILKDIISADFDAAGNLTTDDKLKNKVWTKKTVDKIKSELNETQMKKWIDWFEELKKITEEFLKEIDEAKGLVSFGNLTKSNLIPQYLQGYFKDPNFDLVKAQSRLWNEFSDLGPPWRTGIKRMDDAYFKEWKDNIWPNSRAKLDELVAWYNEVVEHFENIENEVQQAKALKISLNGFFWKGIQPEKGDRTLKDLLKEITDADFDAEGKLIKPNKLKNKAWTQQAVDKIKTKLSKAKIQQHIDGFQEIQQYIEEIKINEYAQKAQALLNLDWDKLLPYYLSSKGTISNNEKKSYPGITEADFDATPMLNDWINNRRDLLPLKNKLDEIKEFFNYWKTRIKEQIDWFEKITEYIEKIREKAQEAKTLVNLDNFFIRSFLKNITDANYDAKQAIIDLLKSRFGASRWPLKEDTVNDFERFWKEEKKRIENQVNWFYEVKQHFEKIKNAIRDAKFLEIDLNSLLQTTLLSSITNADFDAAGNLKTDDKLKKKVWTEQAVDNIKAALNEAQIQDKIKATKNLDATKERTVQLWDKLAYLETIGALNEAFWKRLSSPPIVLKDTGALQQILSLNDQQKTIIETEKARIEEEKARIEEEKARIQEQAKYLEEIKLYLDSIQTAIRDAKFLEINLDSLLQATLLSSITNADFDLAGTLQTAAVTKLKNLEWSQTAVDKLKTELDKTRIWAKIKAAQDLDPAKIRTVRIWYILENLQTSGALNEVVWQKLNLAPIVLSDPVALQQTIAFDDQQKAMIENYGALTYLKSIYQNQRNAIDGQNRVKSFIKEFIETKNWFGDYRYFNDANYSQEVQSGADLDWSKYKDVIQNNELDQLDDRLKTFLQMLINRDQIRDSLWKEIVFMYFVEGGIWSEDYWRTFD